MVTASLDLAPVTSETAAAMDARQQATTEHEEEDGVMERHIGTINSP